MIRKSAICSSLVIAVWILLACGQNLEAGQRRFAFVYESMTSPQGEIEFQNWVTWRNGLDFGNKVEFPHEIEYGITERLQAALSLADWEVTD
jgi:hypothetical protein